MQLSPVSCVMSHTRFLGVGKVKLCGSDVVLGRCSRFNMN
jgi:hypothetical protein